MAQNKLIIFDFDGVIFDTEYPTFSFYRDILPQYGIHLTEDDFRFKAGRKSIDFFRDVMKEEFDQSLVDALIRQKRQAFQQDIRRYLTPIDGAFKLIQDCFQSGLILALGSQNERELINAALAQFNLRQYFAVVRSLQDVQNKKPDPEIFLNITNELNIKPKQSVIIEDSVEGTQAAKAGGFKIVGVTSSTSAEALHLADVIVNTPAELSVQQLRDLR